MATNAAWDYLRTVARQPQRAATPWKQKTCAAAAPTPSTHSPPRKNGPRQRHAERVLGPDRTFVDLFFLQGHTPEQIAEEMQISVKTVYSKKHKIRCRLESVLGRLRGSRCLRHHEPCISPVAFLAANAHCLTLVP